MFTTPLGVRPDQLGNGTSPRDMRHALAGLVTTQGVLDGLTVTGRDDWSYAIAPGHYAVARPENDGTVLGANDAEDLVATDPAPGTGSRIDIIVVHTNEYGTAGANSSEPVPWVLKGIPSGTPVAPTVPEGSIELARKVVAAGDASTNTGAAIQQTGKRAGVGPAPKVFVDNISTASWAFKFVLTREDLPGFTRITAAIPGGIKRTGAAFAFTPAGSNIRNAGGVPGDFEIGGSSQFSPAHLSGAGMNNNNLVVNMAPNGLVAVRSVESVASQTFPSLAVLYVPPMVWIV